MDDTQAEMLRLRLEAISESLRAIVPSAGIMLFVVEDEGDTFHYQVLGSQLRLTQQLAVVDMHRHAILRVLTGERGPMSPD